MGSIEIVGMGAMNMDHLYQVERILLDGEAAIQAFQLQPGGSAANTIYGLARLGIATGFIGAVGDDGAGKALLKDLAGAGVDTSQIRAKKGKRTGTVLCISDSQANRSLYVDPGANNEMNEEDIALEYVNQAQIAHLSSFVQQAQLDLQKRLVAELSPAVKVSLSPGALYAARGFPQLAPLLKRTHVLFANESELRQLTGENVRPGAERCIGEGCSIVVVTSGKGRIRLDEKAQKEPAVCYIRQGQEEHLVKPGKDKVDVVDTTGAGDAFAAGFLFGLLKGKALDQCGLLGDIAARCCIAKAGPRAGLPSLDELTRRYLQYQENE